MGTYGRRTGCPDAAIVELVDDINMCRFFLGGSRGRFARLFRVLALDVVRRERAGGDGRAAQVRK